MGETLVVGRDIILNVQGIPVDEASDHRRVRTSSIAVHPAGNSR
jgi:hypothetical protein